MTDRYVNKGTGANSGAGGSGAPWASLQYANDNCTAGDKILINPGIYYEALTITKANTTWEHDGTAGVVYIDGKYDPDDAWGNSPTHIKGPNDTNNDWLVKEHLANLVNVKANGVTINGKTKYGIMIRYTMGRAISTSPGYSNITVKFVRTDFCYNGGWRINSDDTLIEDCCCTRSGMQYYDSDRSEHIPGLGPAGVPTSTSTFGNNITIRRHHSQANYGEGIVADIGSQNVTIEYCEAGPNLHMDYYIGHAPNTIVRYNLSWKAANETNFCPLNKTGGGIVLGDEKKRGGAPSGNPKIYGNVVINGKVCFDVRNDGDNYETSVNGLYVGFNTFISNNKTLTDRTMISVDNTAGSTKRALFENNIFECVPGSGVNPVSWQLTGSDVGVRNNIWRAQPTTNARGVGDIYGDPKLKNSGYVAPTTIGFNKYAATFTPVSIRASADFFKVLPSSPATPTNSTSGAASGGGAYKNNTPPTGMLDYYGATRLTGTARTIGAYEFDGTVSEPDDTLTTTFTQSATSGAAPLVVDFTDTSMSTGTVNEWLWDFGDGNTDTVQNPTHTYSVPGQWTPTLIARDSNGVQDDYTGAIITVSQSDPGGGGDGINGFAIQRFTAPTSDGPGSVVFDNLGGATVKSVIAMLVGATSTETVTDGAIYSVGYAVGAGNDNQLCWDGYSGDAQAPTVAKHRLSTTAGAVLVAIDSAGEPAGQLKITAFEADTVYYTVSTGEAFPAGYQCVFLAMAGNGISATTAVGDTLGAAGSTNPLGVPAADVAMLLNSFTTSNQPMDDIELSLGFADKQTQYAFNWYDRNGAATSALKSWTGPEGVIGRSWSRDGARVKMVGLGSVPSYQVSEADMNTTTRTLLVRLPGGTQTTVEQIIAPTSTGPRTYPLGYTPGVVIMWGGLNVNADTPRFNNDNASAFWLGFVTQNKSAFICVTSQDNVTTSNTQVWTGDNLEVYKGGNTKVIDTTVSLTETGYAMSWDTTQPMVFNVMAIEQIVIGTTEPVVDFDISPDYGYESTFFTFASTTNANGNTITGYAWDFGDGQTGTGATAYHVYSTPDVYTISLTVTAGGTEYTRTKAYILTVAPSVETVEYVMYPHVPNPAGVDYDTPTFIGLDPNADMAGIISFKLTAKEMRFAAAIENVTSAYQGVVRMLYDPDINGFRFIRPDGSTATITPTWSTDVGSGETPPDAPVLSAISNGDADGNYTVAWGSVSGADYYTLQEKLGGGTYSTVYQGASLSYGVTGNDTGTYTYRVSTTDGELTSNWSSTVSTTVSAGATEVTLRPTASNHDAWENGDVSGTVDIDDPALAINSGTRWGGLYMASSIPQGATINSAILNYKAQSTSYDDANVTWYGNDVDTAAVFTTTDHSISTRTLTTASVTDTEADIGTASYHAVDVTAIVQEIVNRGGFTGPIVLIADGIGASPSTLRMFAYDKGDIGRYWNVVVNYTP